MTGWQNAEGGVCRLGENQSDFSQTGVVFWFVFSGGFPAVFLKIFCFFAAYFLNIKQNYLRK